MWGQSQAREGATTTEREEVRKPVKVWTPPSAKTTETDSQDNKPVSRTQRLWWWVVVVFKIRLKLNNMIENISETKTN